MRGVQDIIRVQETVGKRLKDFQIRSVLKQLRYLGRIDKKFSLPDKYYGAYATRYS